MSESVASRRGVAGERRLVTIAFCDLVGSTILSQRLDPEDYAELVLTYQELAREIIERNGGIVANYAGDGVVAQFGYPDGHENDAERAVVSALEITEQVKELDRTLGAELGERIECRVGMHASVSVVGQMGTNRSDMSIFGDTANIASRVEGVALPGQVIASQAVIDLLADEFATTNHQVVTLRGVDQPTEVAQIIGRTTISRVRSDEVYIGDVPAVEQLRHAWADAEQRQGTFITIAADAGLGKSALVRSFLRELDDPIVIHAKGRALSTSQPFGVLGQLADACIAHPRFDSGHINYDLATKVASLLAAPASSTSAEERWQEIFEAGMALLQAVASELVVIVVEDLHWVDASTEELVERFAKTIDDEPCLLLTTTRPGPRLGTATVIELEPMSDQDMRELVIAYAQMDLSESVIANIVERAQGVPLFGVELARSATADINAALPESLQAALLARLAARPELARVAQVASVLGDVVEISLLSELLDASSDSVVASITALDGDHVLEIETNGRCQFTHSLLREAIYTSMLRKDRRSLHRQAASALTTRGARTDSRASVVGYHLALSAQRLEAAQCYDVAARRAAGLGAFYDTVELAQQGLDALGENAEPSSELLSLTMTLGNAQFATIGYNAPGLLELWQRAESVAADIDNRQEQSSGMNGQSVAALFEGRYQLAIERADRIVSFGTAHNDRSALVRGHCSRALPQLYLGHVTDALANAEQAAALYRDGDYELLTYGFGTDQLAIALTTAATAAYFADDQRSNDFSDAAIAHAVAINSPITQAMAWNSASMIALFADQPDEALAHVGEISQLCDRFGLPFFRMVATLTKAAALALLGDTAATELAYGALTGAEGGSNLALTLGLFSVARCEEATGNKDAAFDLCAMALDLVEQQSERLLEVELRSMQLRCRASQDLADQLTAALSLAHTRGAHGSARRAQALLDSL